MYWQNEAEHLAFCRIELFVRKLRLGGVARSCFELHSTVVDVTAVPPASSHAPRRDVRTLHDTRASSLRVFDPCTAADWLDHPRAVRDGGAPERRCRSGRPLERRSMACCPVDYRSTQFDPEQGKRTTQRAHVRFVCDDAAVYIGARMSDTEGRVAIRPHVARRDANFNRDFLQVVIDG